MSDTGDGRKLLEQALGTSGSASELAKNNPTLRQPNYTGDPADVAPLPLEDALSDPSGNSGTVVFAGFIAQEEYNARLQGRTGLLKYDEMRKSDGTVRWSLQVIKLPIRAAEWRIQEASDSPKDKQIADFVTYNLFERLSWTSILREMMTYLDFGFYVGEKSYVSEIYQPEPIKTDPPKKPTPPPPVPDPITGVIPPAPIPDDDDLEPKITIPPARPMIVLKQLANRKQTTIFRWETGNGDPGVTQVTAQGTFDIPENRLFILTHEREGNNYQGVSLLRSAYKHWYMKDAMYKISAIAAERQGVGVVKIKAMIKPGQTELNKAVEAAENLRSNDKGYLVEPENFDVSFMDMNGRTTLDMAADIEHHDRQIMKNVGAAFMEMGATRQSGATGGSKSASGDQSEVYQQAVEAIANEIQEAVNSMVIRQLVDLNFTGVTKYPTLQHNKIGEADLSGYSKAISDLGTAGFITPDPDLEQSLRARADLPDLPDKIRNDYDNRDRSQADTVPQFAPAVAPGAAPANPNTPGVPKPATKPDPTKPAPVVKANEIVESVKHFYSALGDEIDAATTT